MPNWNVEAEALRLAIGRDVLSGRRLAVDDHLDRHVTRGAHTRPFEVPVRLLIEAPFADCLGFGRRLGTRQIRSDIKGDFDRSRLIETQTADSAVAARLTHRHVIDAKIENMAESVAAITAAVLEALHPVVI